MKVKNKQRNGIVIDVGKATTDEVTISIFQTLRKNNITTLNKL